MGKYNFRIDKIDTNTTHGKILSDVKPCSTVLECGCATGYMTKFMYEKLGCIVDIVEYDEESIKQAQKYSRMSVCGDLMKDDWYQTYHDKRYDHILFADVLEHLSNPMTVLKKASSLLKPDGTIIVSIPNICHNDIIIKMYNDTWQYTNYGLLDNTHIHFWGIKDFILQCAEIGLSCAKADCVTVQTGHTEQAYLGKIDEDLLKALNKRELGCVYQYVITCNRVSEEKEI